MYNTANLTDGNNTNDIATSTGGVSNANPTFKTSNLAVKDEYSQVATTTLSYEDFIEMEFSIKPSTSSGTYCFRITNAGSTTNFTYTRYPETTLTTNEAPVVSDVKLNNQVNIDLMENTTTSTSATADISDSSGCNTITNVLAKLSVLEQTQFIPVPLICNFTLTRLMRALNIGELGLKQLTVVYHIQLLVQLMRLM
jgi:hypothetical protein